MFVPDSLACLLWRPIIGQPETEIQRAAEPWEDLTVEGLLKFGYLPTDPAPGRLDQTDAFAEPELRVVTQGLEGDLEHCSILCPEGAGVVIHQFHSPRSFQQKGSS